MQVNNSTTLYTYTQNQTNVVEKPTQEQLDKARETIVGVAGHRSKEARIDAYVAGTKQANELYEDSKSAREATQNYTDFAADVRRSEGYSTYLNNGGEPLDLIKRDDEASIQSIQNPIEVTPEQTDALRQGLAGIAGYSSTQAQIDAYKAGAQQSESSNNTYQDTQEYVTNYNNFAEQARRGEYINTYIENSKLFA